MVLLFYYPGWFRFKTLPNIQDGAPNFFYLLQLTRDLTPQDMAIAQKVLADNSSWAHCENLVIAMLKDKNEEIRRRAVLWILRARQEFRQEDHPRQFVPPKINLKAENYYDLVDWSTEPCTEPPLTLDFSEEKLLNVISQPYTLPNYPSHTQAVERKVRVVTEAADKRVGHSSRHQLILQLEKSRNLVPRFNTKKNDDYKEM